MTIFPTSNTDPGVLVESSGNTFVLSGVDGLALIKKYGDKDYIFLKDQDGSKILVNNNEAKVIGAERSNSVNYVSIQDIRTSDVTVWEASEEWTLQKKISEASPSTTEYL